MKYDSDCVEILELDISPELIAMLPTKFVNRHKVIPIKLEHGVLTLWTVESKDTSYLDDIGLLLGCKIKVVWGTAEAIEQTIKRYYGQKTETIESIVSDIKQQESIKPYPDGAVSLADIKNGQTRSQDVLPLAEVVPPNEAPVIRLVSLIIAEAVKKRASDIHIELFGREMVVRYRIDGVLYDTQSPPANLYPAIISRIKIMALMNIAERRLPQDGRIELNVNGKQIDIRVSTLPTLYGESLVLRILDKQRIMLELDDIGFSNQLLERYNRLINRSNGVILVTGPTGSGKTTTLYASLDKINSTEKKIITIEDPIEYQLKRVNQLQVKPKIGITFAQGLRSMLRQDPDIMMVGEIRDLETAQVAVQAALTGHLIFSTLHTNDAAHAIIRLHDMGIEDFLIAPSVIGIVAQRLVRVNCPYCQESYISEFALEKTELFRGKGCEKCNNIGFMGRMGIFELLVIDETMRGLIIGHENSDNLKKAAIKNGMIPMLNDGWEKAKQGLTTMEEVLKVVQEED